MHDQTFSKGMLHLVLQLFPECKLFIYSPFQGFLTILDLVSELLHLFELPIAMVGILRAIDLAISSLLASARNVMTRSCVLALCAPGQARSSAYIARRVARPVPGPTRVWELCMALFDSVRELARLDLGLSL